ncbi:MAG: class I SAM-dependent methyltransferase [Acidobacteriota bacterium]
MSVAEHLGIKTSEYDQQILTFIPHYADILDAAAAALDALDRPARLLVDLGTGSGALAARCAKRLKGVRVVGIDADVKMLGLAAKRLGRAFTPLVGTIEGTPFPACDVVTASFSLHHIPSPGTKHDVFARAFKALKPGGMLIDADSLLNGDERLQARDHDEWRRHLATTHGRAGAVKFLAAWAGEDTYFPLDIETALLRDVGFSVDVTWRRGAFAVLAATKPRGRARRSSRVG